MGRKDERGWPGLRAHAPCTGWGPTARDQKDRPVATRRGVSRFMAVTHRLKKGAPPRDSCRRSGRPAETSELDDVECPFLRQELAMTETASGASVEYAPEIEISCVQKALSVKIV